MIFSRLKEKKTGIWIQRLYKQSAGVRLYSESAITTQKGSKMNLIWRQNEPTDSLKTLENFNSRCVLQYRWTWFGRCKGSFQSGKWFPKLAARIETEKRRLSYCLSKDSSVSEASFISLWPSDAGRIYVNMKPGLTQREDECQSDSKFVNLCL